MKTVLSVIALLVVTGIAQDRKAESPTYMIRLHESVMYTHPTAGPNVILNCAVVYPDGRLHLELRRQEFIGGTATLQTYESRLNSDQLSILQRLIQAPSIQQLNPYIPPITPMTSDELRSFGAEIARGGSKLQNVGYFTWEGDPPRNPDSDKGVWRESSIKLQPLVDWFHALKSYHKSLNWREVEKPNSVCGG